MAIQAIFTTGVTEITIAGLTHWDYGQTLEITCTALPTAYEVHFTNKHSAEAIIRTATADLSGVGSF